MKQLPLFGSPLHGMKEDQRKALDRELRRERFRGKRTWILIILGVVLVLGIYTPVLLTTLQGETIAAEARERGGSVKMELKVRLASGEVVSMIAEANEPHRAGANVEISRMRSLAGITTYQFVRYLQ